MPTLGSPAPLEPAPRREEVEKWLRDAYNHLYDIRFLENHPLGDLLVRPEEASGKRGADLRKVLIAAIQARKPPRGTPAQSPDARGYQILEQHVLAGLSPGEVAQKLNISRSLFFLEKARILKVIFDDLWTRRVLPAAAEDAPPAAEISEAEELLRGAAFEPVDIPSLLASLRPLVEPLARAQNARVAIQAEAEGLIPAADRVLLRQVLLSLLSELLQLSADLELSSFARDGEFGVVLAARPENAGRRERLELRLEERRGLRPETAHALIRAMNGRLSIEGEANGIYRATLAWLDQRRKRRLLVVDDHADIADLFTRFLSGAGGAGWEVTWAASAEHARRALAEQRPDVIALDVILPHEDGWEFLIALKADAQTRAIPVVVCSAINEPDLVRSLGAQGYLPKPFSAAQVIQQITNI